MKNAILPSLWVRQNPLIRYAIALLATTGALLIGQELSPVLGNCALYIAAFPAIAFSDWYCGLQPSVASAVLALLGIKYWFLASAPLAATSTARQAIGLTLFLLAAAAIIAMGETRRRDNETLRGAEAQLENRVKQRTAELARANDDLRDLTARLMHFQDEERRRIARELHDSVGQNLAALIMNLNTVGTDIERLSQTAKTVSDSVMLAKEMSQEVRTVSYLLHPPLLDEAGLSSALRWYAEGFSERSKIKVELDLPEDFGRLSEDMEIAIFRTVQECLTNVHRYSGSAVARIELGRSASEIRLKVEDRGTGMSAEKLHELTEAATPGVGIRGMRERMRQLGGNLEIRSDECGTTIEARLPLAISAKVAANVAA